LNYYQYIRTIQPRTVLILASFLGYNQLEALQQASPQQLAELAGSEDGGSGVYVPQYHETDAEYHALEHNGGPGAHPSPYHHLEGSPEFYAGGPGALLEHKYQPHYKSYSSRGESS
jgi:hypothetical protein